MPFHCKQSSMLSCVLCTSQCPPNNVFHEICEYPVYYDALYSPADHVSLFEKKELVCHWLLDGLLDHFSACSSCSSLDDCVHDSTMWKVVGTYQCAHFQDSRHLSITWLHKLVHIPFFTCFVFFSSVVISYMTLRYVFLSLIVLPRPNRYIVMPLIV